MTTPPPAPLSTSTEEQILAVAAIFDSAEAKSSAAAHSYHRLLAHYYNLLIPADASVLEIGCGGGELLALLSAREKTGVDISAVQLERAKARLPGATFHQQARPSTT
jgi:cyclopropane fatty-acyl-phospholipid synthase-like methyltransferase